MDSHNLVYVNHAFNHHEFMHLYTHVSFVLAIVCHICWFPFMQMNVLLSFGWWIVLVGQKGE